MALNLKLQMRLSQQLIMTPQLQQAIKLLQLSRNELEELIEQALVENPVLEEGADPAEPEPATEEPIAASQTVDAAEDVATEAGHPENDLEWQQYVASGSGVIAERSPRGDDDAPGIEATLADADTLRDHLMWQLEMAPLSPIEMEIGEHLIGNLDDDGYLTLSVQELLELNPDLHRRIEQGLRKGQTHLPPPADCDPGVFTSKHASAQPLETSRGRKKKKAPPTFVEEEAAPAPPAADPIKVSPKACGAVEAVLRYLQTFDPIGVGARDLRECLEIQLRAMGLAEALPLRIVHNDLKLLENKDLRRIARRNKVEVEEVVEAYKLIISLEPKPGRPYSGERPQHIIPDVFIFKFSDTATEAEDRVGQYRIVLNESGLPRLRINDFYRDLAERSARDSSLTQEYIVEKIKAGNWLMKSIEQRQKTIFRVTKSILKHQYEFFEKGISFLRPLVLKDVAEDIGVHESTVSRITTNKYAHTPQGIYELKYFFTSGIDQGQGEVISSKKIKDMIQKIIAAEDNREPLTDIQIAERLSKANNIKVARRTVAKYREALNLLPSNKRKQLF
ncbi:MAG: RNA polymerase factor sigma-54 [Candidatus Lambdaproteobacteria bacterium]|nr:RNA polymerase factor sigma-54 [Candidatus Lambdaproteobacteria bacterium]